jgi:hypothetical protein
MKGVENKFVIKKGIVPESLYWGGKLLIHQGEQYPIVYDIYNKCVGVVLEHFNHERNANGQAEICFFDSYFSDYGKWHRMFYDGHRGGERIKYEQLQTDLKNGEYTYIGYIMGK